MLNGGSMVWGFCVYFVYMIPLETDVLRKHRFQKPVKFQKNLYKTVRGVAPTRYPLSIHIVIDNARKMAKFNLRKK